MVTYVSILDGAGDGSIHIVALVGRVAYYLRHTDRHHATPATPPHWLNEAVHVKSWDNKNHEVMKTRKRTLAMQEALQGMRENHASYTWESRPVEGGYGLAIYHRDHAARRVTIAALHGTVNTMA